MIINEFRGTWAFLSNFYPSPFTVEGTNYATAEHYFQSCKTTDPAWRSTIANAVSPLLAKHHGRSAPLIREWEAVKLTAMRRTLELKFAHGSALANSLHYTGDYYLQEGNAWGDRYWGVVDGIGQNWLGHLLVARRAELRALLV